MVVVFAKEKFDLIITLLKSFMLKVKMALFQEKILENLALRVKDEEWIISRFYHEPSSSIPYRFFHEATRRVMLF